MKKRLDKLFMVLILRSLHSDYDHVRIQILSVDQIPSINSLVTRFLCVPTLVKGENAVVAVEASAMVASHGRGKGSCGNRGGGRGGGGGRGKLWCSYCGKENHTQNKCYDLHGWPDKTTNVFTSEKAESRFSDEEYQEYLMLKSSSQTQSTSVPSVSTACISQSVEGQGPLIVDPGASDHIYGNYSLFSSISSPKFPHLITLAYGSKIASQGIGQVPLFLSLNLNFVFYIPNCPYNLISLGQLTRSFNCLVTFDVYSFVIQDRGMGRLIGVGHESRGLYYLETNPFVSCFASSSSKFLHEHLGHLGLAKLKIMIPSLSKLQILDCESCQLGKYVRSSFPKQVEKRCN
ncbi:hypothetical protein AAZX31_08G334800 [Glycine max]